MATARANNSDAVVNTAVTQAQAAVNAYIATRYNENGVEANTGTTYSLAQLQARASNAQAAADSHVSVQDNSADLAQELKDGIALYLSGGNSDAGANDDALDALTGAIDAYLADTSVTGAEASKVAIVSETVLVADGFSPVMAETRRCA